MKRSISRWLSNPKPRDLINTQNSGCDRKILQFPSQRQIRFAFQSIGMVSSKIRRHRTHKLQKWRSAITWAILLFICCSTTGFASLGDLDYDFVECYSECLSFTCSYRWTSKFGSGFPYWNCSDDCSYDCMHRITDDRFKFGYGPLKYYGHWPFRRIMGLEEPASALFSILNGVPYFIDLVRSFFSSSGERSTYFMSSWLLCYYPIAIFTWLASARFHCRKTELTSLVDYAFALLFLGYSLWLAVRRIWGDKADRRKVSAVFITVLSMYIHRVVRMYNGQVSFDDHMRVSITVALLNVLTWLSWLIFSKEEIKGDGKYRYLCLICQLWFASAALLELFDFPALWGLFDAHSLWHAATIPLGFIWSRFWYVDKEAHRIRTKQD